MIIKNAELEIVCGPTSKLPAVSLPEIAFAGKSNVGKSSLINALLGRKSLARTSEKPGKTQTINFYNINKEFYFVDLPGYGYAKASREAQAKWGQMIEKYLRSSKQLKIIFLLIDIRHGPKDHDRQMYDWIVYNGFRPYIIATKSDKIGKNAVKGQLKAICDSLDIKKEIEDPLAGIIPFSSETKAGKEEVWKLIEETIG